MRFKKPISDIHQENEVIFGNLLDASELPDLPIYHTINKPVHFVMSVVFGLVFLAVGVFGLLSIPVFWAQSPNTPWFLIGVVMAFASWWGTLMCFARLFALRQPYMLAIYDNGVAFLRQDWHKNHEFIGFDRAYLTEFWIERNGAGKLVLHYIALSDDEQYYQTHKVAIGRFFSYEKADIAYYDKLINTLIQQYHKAHQIDKVPKMKFIRQR